MNTQKIELKIKDFIENNTQTTIKNVADDLIEKGVIDSFTIFKLIDFIEKFFKIKIDIDKLSPSNFNSVNNISKMVSEKLNK